MKTLMAAMIGFDGTVTLETNDENLQIYFFNTHLNNSHLCKEFFLAFAEAVNSPIWSRTVSIVNAGTFCMPKDFMLIQVFQTLSCGVADRYIGTITCMVRAMLIHCALLWPKQQSKFEHWPMAMDHAVWVWNNLPMEIKKKKRKGKQRK